MKADMSETGMEITTIIEFRMLCMKTYMINATRSTARIKSIITESTDLLVTMLSSLITVNLRLLEVFSLSIIFSDSEIFSLISTVFPSGDFFIIIAIPFSPLYLATEDNSTMPSLTSATSLILTGVPAGGP